MLHLEQLTALPLHVPLREPFVIATARMDTTRAALVRVVVRDRDRTAVGLGEAAPLHPVTHEDWPDLERTFTELARTLPGTSFGALDELPLPDASPVARAGLEAALLDAVARLRGVPVAALLAPPPFATRLVTDVTLPIAAPERMAELARAWWAQGFRCFKVKVGKDLDADVRALRAILGATPTARLRLDANAGFAATEALALLASVAREHVECFEQPCAREDLDAMAKVTREGGVTVVADESVRSLAELDRVLAARAAHGVNLKLVKHGGLRAAHAIGARARASGLRLMCGAMVETRLGLCAMAHVVAALGGADFVDLDTAFLLAEERFRGGWAVEGPTIELALGAGLGVAEVSG